MIKEAIEQLTDGNDLSYDCVNQCMSEIMSGDTDPILISAYLTALKMKGETIDEISGSAKGMRNAGRKLEHDMDLLEIVGTGGDKAFTFNISTTSAIVVSAAGYPIAKHGNRGVSSKSGAADVLEALGMKIDLEPEQSSKVLKETGFCFLFAQKYHTSMKYVGPVRAKLGMRTIFNILGPLTNPAGANMNIIGVYSKDLVEPLAKVLIKLGVKKGMVVFGEDVMDEISVSSKTFCCEFRDGNIKTYEINPEDYGMNLCKKSELVGGDAKENAQITRDILNGAKGPKRDIVLMNSAACIYIAEDNMTFEEAIKIASDTIDSGKAAKQLEKIVEMTNSFNA